MRAFIARAGLDRLAGLGLAAALAACATTPAPPIALPPAPHAAPAPTSPAAPALAWSALPGWDEEDHLGAMQALYAACAATRQAQMGRVCADAKADPPASDAQARRFLEAELDPVAMPGEGLLTAYFAPVYEARQTPEPPFTAPVRPKPGVLDLLLASVLAEPDSPEAGAGDDIAVPPPSGPDVDAGPPQPDRAAIEAMPADDALAWMRPEDLFFLQIQGSGILVLPDGRRLRAAFAGSNGRPFVGIARVMRTRGLIDDASSSGETIRAWLAAHRGPEADALMDENPRYVFFKTIPDDGRDPAGAAGVPLPAGRALAVDPAFNALGGLYWIDAEAPALKGAFPVYRRLAASLDVGGAIKGPVRADLYLGQGDAAGREAGRVRHVLRLYRLVPRVGASQLAASR